jgi:hypothetical protein
MMMMMTTTTIIMWIHRHSPPVRRWLFKDENTNSMIYCGTGLSDHKWYHCAYKTFPPAKVSTCQLYYLFIRRKHLLKECMF